MKKLIFFVLCFFSISTWAQVIIENPKCGMSKESFLIIEKIELNKTQTILHFNLKYRPNWKIIIPKSTYIQPEGGEKLMIIDSEGIPLGENFKMPKSGEVSYSLVFPPIDPDTRKIDYRESNNNRSWFFYDICLKEESVDRRVDNEVYGEWYDTKSGVLELCFFDTVVVYKNAIWRYNNVDLKNGSGTISLSAGKDNIIINLKRKKNELLAGEQGGNMTLLGKSRNMKASISEPLQSPVLSEDSAVFSGYLYKYNPESGLKEFTLLVNNIFKGKQEKFNVEIENSGYFSTKIPLNYPHQVYLKTDVYNMETIYLEPGKELFYLISFASGRKKTLQFMGELAGINNELKYLERINSLNYSELQEKILDMDSHEFVTYNKNLWFQEKSELESIFNDKKVSEKAYQIKKIDIDYKYARHILSYSSDYEDAYRKKHKIDRRKQRNLDIEIDSLKIEDLTFITNSFVNNDLALVSNNYKYFINNLRYSDNLRSESGVISISEAVELFLINNQQPTKIERQIVNGIYKQDSIRNLPEYVAYASKYNNRERVFYQKYSNVFKHLFDSLKISLNMEMIKHYEESKGRMMNDEENELIAANKMIRLLYDDELKNAFLNIPRDSILAFNKKMNAYYATANIVAGSEKRIELFQKHFDVEPGLITDLMLSEDLLRTICDEKKTLNPNELSFITKQITSSFIIEYINRCNEQTIADIAYRKANPLCHVNEVSNVEDENVFETIIKKYEGKVVYVDFWATWCGPCRTGIERIAPLKEEMVNDDVVFVYITGDSSPQGTWANMIPNIRGEHYRLTKSQWKFLGDKYKISGIPRCMMIDKQGKMVNDNLGHLQNDVIKQMLLEQIVK